MDKDLPTLFRRNGRVGLLAAFFAACWILSWFPVDGKVSVYAADILMINAEILVTTLAVTLGVTLLGIQFRAQSYTIIAMIQQMKNSVVYAFISIFVFLIIVSIMLVPYAAPLSIEDGKVIGNDQLISGDLIAKFIPYLFLATIFSMLYLAGYIYYMINKLEPKQMVQTVMYDINETVFKYKDKSNIASNLFMLISKKDSKEERDKKTKHGRKKRYDVDDYKDLNVKIAVWGQIMLRAVELNNTLLFEMGLKELIDMYDCSIKMIKKVNVSEMIEKDNETGEFLYNEITRLVDREEVQPDKLIEIYMISKRIDRIKAGKLLESTEAIQFLSDGIKKLRQEEEIQFEDLIVIHNDVIASVPGAEKLSDKDKKDAMIMIYADTLSQNNTVDDKLAEYAVEVDKLIKNKETEDIYRKIDELPFDAKREIMRRLFKQFFSNYADKAMRRNIKNFFFDHIVEIGLNCVQHDRQTCSDAFFEAFADNKEDIPTQKEFLKDSYRNMMFDLWSVIMKNSILSGKVQIIRSGVNSFNKKLNATNAYRERDIKPISERNRWTMMFYHNCIALLVRHAIDPTVDTNNEYLRRYLQNFGRYKFPENIISNKIEEKSADIANIGKTLPSKIGGVTNINLSEHPTPIDTWDMIMYHAYMQRNPVIFKIGLDEMKKDLQNDDEYEHDLSMDALSELIERILEQHSLLQGAENIYSKYCLIYFLNRFTDLSWLWPIRDLRMNMLWIGCIEVIMEDREKKTLKYFRQQLELSKNEVANPSPDLTKHETVRNSLIAKLDDIINAPLDDET